MSLRLYERNKEIGTVLAIARQQRGLTITACAEYIATTPRRYRAIERGAVAVIHNDVIPFYQAREIAIGAILTDNGREFCGTEHHPYELYLALNDIEHRRTKVKRPQTNGFVERFQQTVGNEFFSVTLRQQFYTSIEELQQDLDGWLVHYNTERPHQGYRNMGKRPIDTVNAYLKERALAEPAQKHLTRSVSQEG